MVLARGPLAGRFRGTHLKQLANLGKSHIDKDLMDLTPEGKPLPPPAAVKSRTELYIALFDSNVAQGRAAIAAMSDEDLFNPWTLQNNGKQILTRLPQGQIGLRDIRKYEASRREAPAGCFLRLLLHALVLLIHQLLSSHFFRR